LWGTRREKKTQEGCGEKKKSTQKKSNRHAICALGGVAPSYRGGGEKKGRKRTKKAGEEK